MSSRYQNISFGPGSGPMPPAIRWLLISNGVIFLFQEILRLGGFESWQYILVFGLVPLKVLWQLHVWQPVTYLFLHGDIFHLALNMLMLWMFGTPLERHWGTRRFVNYYLICGVGAAVLTILLALPFPSFRVPTIGASGAILGLLMAYGLLWPQRVVLIWGIFPMKARTMVLLFGGLQLYALIFAGGQGNIAYAAHVGGMLAGYLYLKRAWKVGPFLAELRWKLRRRRFRIMDRRDDDFPYH
jgi:rhomboid family protein